MSAVVTSENASRVFPMVGPDMHAPANEDETPSQPSPAQQTVSALLALGRRQLNPMQRWSGIGLAPVGRAGRLFRFHRLAVEAEIDGRFKRADFFWRETYRQVKRASLDSSFWPAVFESVSVPAVAPSVDLSHIVVREVVIDTHHAWMRSYLEQTPEPDANSRAFLHLRYVKDYVDIIDLDMPAKQALIGSATLLEIKARERSHEWKMAEDLARDLLSRFPEETLYQDAAAATYVTQALGTLKNERSCFTQS